MILVCLDKMYSCHDFYKQKKPSLFKHCKEARLELTVQIYKDFFIRAIFFVENAVFSHGSFIFRFGS